jgi:SAM-dependent methyltransferase
MKLAVQVTPEILDSGWAVAAKVAAALGYPDGRPSFEHYLSVGKQVRQLRRVARKTVIDLRHSRVLEIGSGCGMFLCVANRLSLDCCGLSPACGSYRGQFSAGQKLLSHNGISRDRIIDASAEHIPFEAGSFDLVVCFDVIEHVGNPLRVVQESLRVLRPGGWFYAHGASSCWFWEWHYAIPWLPGMPRWAAKRWVRLFRRNPDFLDDLNLVTTWGFRKRLLSLDQAAAVEVCDDASSRPPSADPECAANKWLDDVECNEVVEVTGVARGSGWGLKWSQFVMRPAIRRLLERFSIVPLLEIVVRKHEWQESSSHVQRPAR